MENINQAAIAVSRFVFKKWKWPSELVLFYGRSIGSGPSCYLARLTAQSGRKIGGVILQSAFTSLEDIVRGMAGQVGNFASLLLPEAWDNKQFMSAVSKDCPVLLLHGLHDTIIPWRHSKELYDW